MDASAMRRTVRWVRRNLPQGFLEWGDRIGVMNSTMCMAHGMALPVTASLGIAFVAHPALALVFAALAALSVLLASWAPHHPAIIPMLWIPVLLFTLSVLVDDSGPWMPAIGHMSSGMLLAGHVMNHRYRLRRTRQA